MRQFLLGLRVLLGTGRDSLTRLVLMALGATVGAVALLGLASIPVVADAQAEVLRQQSLAGDEFDPDPPLRASVAEERYNDRFLTRITINVIDPAADPPTWIDRYPDPGEIVVSPALESLIEHDPTIAARFPQQRIQTLDDAVIAPDQLYAVVGTTSADLPANTPNVRAATGFGTDTRPSDGPDPRAVRLIVVGAALFIVLPTAAFLATSARLSARSRRRRLAALRLIGLTSRQTSVVASIEIAAISLVGALAGVVVWRIARPISEHVGLANLRWWAADIAAPIWLIAAIVAGVVALSVVVAHSSVRGAVRSPLTERQPAPPQHARWGRIAPLGVGLTALVAALVTSSPANDNAWFVLFAGANILCGFGLLAAMPAVAVLAGRLIEAASNRRSASLAARRIAFEPTAVGRTTTGLLIVVFLAAFGQSMLVTLDWAIGNTSPTTDDAPVVVLDNAPIDQRQIEAITGTQSAVALQSLPTVDGDTARVAVADCEALAVVADTFGDNCDNTGLQPLLPGGGEQTLLVAGDVDVAEALTAATTRNGQTNPIANFRLSPALLPADTPAAREWIIRLTPEVDLDRYTSEIVAIAPATEVRTGDGVERGRLASTYRALVTAATLAAVLITLATTIAAIVDRTIERRRNSNQLLALGISPRTLRRIEALWIGVPLTIGLFIAAVIAVLTGSAYLRFGDTSLRFPFADLAVIFAAGLVGVAATTTAAVLATPTRYHDGQIDET